MRYSRRSSLFVVFALAIAATGPEARAGFVTYTVATPTLKPTDYIQALAVPGFNPALGSLETVTFSIATDAHILGSLKNNSASMRTFSINEDVVFTASFLGTHIASNALNAQKKNVSVANGETATFGMYSLSGNSGLTTVLDPTALAAFTTPNSVDFSFSTLTGTTIGGGGGNVFTKFTTTADATLTVTYNYITLNSVPEPASLAMTLLGGLAVATAGYVRTRRDEARGPAAS